MPPVAALGATQGCRRYDGRRNLTPDGPVVMGMTSPSLPVATPRARVSRGMQSPWVFGPVVGAVIGLPILGIGSRIAMRLVAVGTNRPGAFTVEGSLTVIFFGVVAGIAGGAIYATLARFLPQRTATRSILFDVIIVVLTLRGVAPATALTLSLFLPLTVAYAIVLDVIWRRSPLAYAATPGTSPPA